MSNLLNQSDEHSWLYR